MTAKSSRERLEEGLHVLEGAGLDPELMNITRTAAEFHGHLCPGLAVGCVAGWLALKVARRAEDEELVAVVENDACGVDAIQTATGCTFGKGNLVFRDFGKTVYSFFNRETGKAIRLSLRPGSFEKGRDPKQKELFARVRAGTASGEEEQTFWTGHLLRTREFLERGEELFDVRETEEEPPQKARIFDSLPCDACGESTMKTRLRERGDRTLCTPCLEKGKGVLE